jgi:predicted O-linked N-acetylglucosamine transferase (SPINDLY family)
MKHYNLSRSMCEWDELDAWRAKIRERLARGDAGLVPPFLLLALPGISAAEQRSCAELWLQTRIRDAALAHPDTAFSFAERPAGRLRIGYLSSDFHDHATVHLLIEMFEAHDREQFELFAFSYGVDDGKVMRTRLLQCFEHFVEVQALSNLEIAQRIHAAGIDILVDLKGYTQGSRSAVLAFRPAPVQVNFLGYPGTLGAGLCDYIITDPYLTPASSAADFSEAFAYLPDSYQPHGRQAEIGAQPTRQSQGLPEEGMVFCCFNQAYKITPEVFDTWCRILADCPGSVLWLLKDKLAEGNLRNRAMQRGISPERLVFAPHLPQVEHLGRLQCADLILDTTPYNAHTTASDALWVGVPLISSVGDTFAARVAGSLLSTVGLQALIADDLVHYHALACALAQDPARLQALRLQLAGQRDASALFDVPRYTRHLEALYALMWQAHQTSGPLQSIMARRAD